MRTSCVVCCMAIAAALSAPVAAQKADPKKAAKKKPVKIEKLACRLGTEDEHARIAVQLADGKVDSFAYYSKWKPRTCSMTSADDASASGGHGRPTVGDPHGEGRLTD